MSSKITEYQLCDLGIEHSQYFQGFGTAFTDYSECAYGIGDNPREALDDCLEMIAQQGYDVADLEARIKADHGELPDYPSVSAEQAEASELDDSDDEGDDECYDCDESSDCYYHVGIRFNVSAE